MASFSTFRGQVPYDETRDFHQESDNDSGINEAVRICRVSADNLQQFFEAMLPDVSAGPTDALLADSVYLGTYDGMDTSDAYNGQVVGSNNGPVLARRKLLRNLPEAHPMLPGLYVKKCEVQGGSGYASVTQSSNPYVPAGVMTPPQGMILRRFDPNVADANRSAGLVDVAVHYGALPYAVVSDDLTNQPGQSEIIRYVSRQVAPAGESMPLPGTQSNGLFWYSDESGGGKTQQVQTTIIRPITKIHLIYTWHMIPAEAIPRASWMLMGCVNYGGGTSGNRGGSVLFDTLTWPPCLIREVAPNGTARNGMLEGKVLYMYPEISKQYKTISETFVVDISYHLLFRPQGHNRFITPWGGLYRWNRIAVPIPSGQTYTGNWGAGVMPVGNQAFPGGLNLYDFADLTSLFKIDFAPNESNTSNIYLPDPGYVGE